MAPADEIWVHPCSDFVASGLALETLLLRGLFDNLSVTPEFEALYGKSWWLPPMRHTPANARPPSRADVFRGGKDTGQQGLRDFMDPATDYFIRFGDWAGATLANLAS